MLEQHMLFPLSDAVKRCAQCKLAKPVTDFFKRRADSDDRIAYCKPCNTERCRIWRGQNRDHSNESKRRNRQKPEIKAQRAAYDRVYQAANPGMGREKTRRWRENHPEYVETARENARRWHQEHREQRNADKKVWTAANLDHVNRQRRERLNAKLAADPEFAARYRLNLGMANSINHSLNGRKNGVRWQNLVEYILEDLMSHLESQFLPGMTWENRTLDGWHIDHIRPRASFTYTTPDAPEFKECWALSNLRPLWAIDNLRKGGRWFDDGVQTL